MSIEAPARAPGLWRWRMALPVVLAVAVTLIAAITTRFMAIELVLAGALGVAAILLVRMEPMWMVMVLALTRASLEGLQNHSAAHVGKVGLAPGDILAVAFLLGGAWWLWSEFRAGNDFWQAPSILPALFLIALSTFSLGYSPSKALGARDLVKWTSGFLAYPVLLASRPDPRRLRLLLWLLVAGSILPLGVGLWQFLHSIGKPNLFHGGLRIQSVFEHPNTYGFYLVSMMVAAWGLRPTTTGWRRRFLTLVALAAFLSTFLTLSRTVWAVDVVVLLVVGWRYRRVLLWGTAIGAIILVAVPRFLARFTDLFHPRTGVGNHGNSLVGRLSIWSGEFQQWKAKPLLGHGWGFTLADQTKASHNDYLRMLVEVGVVGFVAIIVLMASLVRWAWQQGKSRIDLPRAFLGLALGYVIESMFANNMGKGVYQFHFWVLAGISAVWARTVPSPASGGADPEHAASSYE